MQPGGPQLSAGNESVIKRTRPAVRDPPLPLDLRARVAGMQRELPVAGTARTQGVGHQAVVDWGLCAPFHRPVSKVLLTFTQCTEAFATSAARTTAVPDSKHALPTHCYPLRFLGRLTVPPSKLTSRGVRPPHRNIRSCRSTRSDAGRRQMAAERLLVKGSNLRCRPVGDIRCPAWADEKRSITRRLHRMVARQASTIDDRRSPPRSAGRSQPAELGHRSASAATGLSC